jgi:small subunit ribosomal protein S2
MSDPTAQAPVQHDAGAPARVPPPSSPSQTAEALRSAELSVRDLMEAGVHFGHQTRRWNPRMSRFLFGERNGVHIIDLDQTLPLFQEALEFVSETTAGGGKVLFVGTKRQAQAPIQLEALRSGQFYVNNRWLGGMLTNFKTVKKSIERYKELLALSSDEVKFAEHSKKERSRVTRQSEKYRKSLEGIREMTRLPDLVFVVDVIRESIAVSEARRLGIPIVAVVDSNCNPLGVDYVIPGNDDATRAIQLYCTRVADAALEGAAFHNERLQSQGPRDEKPEELVPTTGTGRVVVEIKQPPRRGRGATSFVGRRREAEPERAPVVVEPAPVPERVEPA